LFIKKIKNKTMSNKKTNNIYIYNDIEYK